MPMKIPKSTKVKALLETLLRGASVTNSERDFGNSGDAEQLSHSNFRRRLVQDTFNYFLSKVVPGLMGFLSVLVFVRLVGVEQYGRYALVFAFVMASVSGLAGWLSQGILRFQSQWREPVEAENFLRSAVMGTILSVAVGEIVLAIAIPAFGVQRGWPLLISLAFFGVLLVYTVTRARFQASLRSATVLRFETVRSIGGFVIPVVLIWITHSRDYLLLLLGLALGYLLPLFGPIFSRTKTHVVSAHAWRTRWLGGEEKRILRQVWGYGWPVALWLLCQQGLVVSDRYFIQRFLGYSAAGVYSSMYDTIVRSFSLIFVPITLAVHPLVMNRWNKGERSDALLVISTAFRYQLLLSVPVCATLYFLAPTVSRLILGREVPEATTVVLPLALGGILWQLAGLAHKPLEILCQTRRMLLAIFASIFINVAGNIIFIPRFGYRAPACLTVASSLAYLLMLFLLTSRVDLRRAVSSSQLQGPAATVPETTRGLQVSPND